MQSNGTKIKNGKNIADTTRRIAYQILESNDNNGEIIIAGINQNGALLAKNLCVILHQVSENKITFAKLNLDKDNPRNKITISIPLEDCKNKTVVVVDDVLNTGSTLLYAVNHFLAIPLQQIRTVVLVNRNHKKFPIKADFKGISLSTSIKEHIEVILEGQNAGIYLS